MANSLVRCCCGVGCAACWIFIGIWAFFFLGILALLFHLGKQGNIGHFSHPAQENATVLLITWCIYVVILIGCSVNLYYRLHHPWGEEVPEAEQRDPLPTGEEVSEVSAVR
jgi:H+/Cl- antiporter ClcA